MCRFGFPLPLSRALSPPKPCAACRKRRIVRPHATRAARVERSMSGSGASRSASPVLRAKTEKRRPLRVHFLLACRGRASANTGEDKRARARLLKKGGLVAETG